VRGVQFRNGQPVNETINSLKWGRISRNFNPDTGQSPIKDDAVCPGDGVIPAWSARLVTTPAQNIRTVTGDFEHMNIMNTDEIQNELADILGLPQMMAMRRGKRRSRKKIIATRKETLNFLQGLKAVRTRRGLKSKLDQEQATRRYLAKYSLPELRQLMSRAFVDALKSPSQKLGRMPKKIAARPPNGGYKDDQSGGPPRKPSSKRAK
jgi:hypothetical protein